MSNPEAAEPINISFVVSNESSSTHQITAHTGGMNHLTTTPQEAYLNPGNLTLFRVKGEPRPNDSLSVVLLAIPFNSEDLQSLDGKKFQVSIRIS